MKINILNNTNFNGISSLKIKKAATKLTDKAEKNLQENLRYFKAVIYDADAKVFYDSKTKERFNGKILIPGNDLVTIEHIQNGTLTASHIRTKSGELLFSRRMRASKNFPSTMTPAQKKAELEILDTREENATNDMIQRFKIKK